jgi:hypothetical protein
MRVMASFSEVIQELRKVMWQDYQPFLQALAGEGLPACNQLNELLRDGLASESAQAIRFVPSDQLGDQAYEQRIYTTGQVSTRSDNWHDLFNALVWMRFPRIKTAMNAMHYHAWSEQKNGRRGDLRDALTLFDECGVIVVSNELNLLRALAERRWNEAFLSDDFSNNVKLSICGHAILEKYLSPYKSMTAKALLIHVDADFMRLPRQEMLTCLDREVAKRLRSGKLLTRPACLAPLPLAGVPGWWPVDEQEDGAFYQDLQVFRPPPANLIPAPVVSFG